MTLSGRELLPKRKTKLIATLGPACSSRERIAELITCGLDVARLNFSHGTHEEHTKLLHLIREEAKKQGRHIAVFQDLCGPKVRISEIDGGSCNLTEGNTIAIKHGEELSSLETLYVQAFDPVKILKKEHKVLLSDGQIVLITESVTEDTVTCRIKAGGNLRSRSGIAVPDSKLKISCLTDKDRHDVEWAIKNNLDYVALSFVDTAKDVVELRELIQSKNASIPIIAKIERGSSLDHIEDIVEVSDAVMVARGDLGLELPLERVPAAQSLIINAANHNGTPVIVATQMLMSMVTQLRPTRAEVNDVYVAVRDGASAVMLSDETAIGKHPAEAISVLDRIVQEAEKESYQGPAHLTQRGKAKQIIPDTICYAACNAADKITATAILACTKSSYTARLTAKYRPRANIFGITSERHSLARMALYWGVTPVLIELPDHASTEDEVAEAMRIVRDQFDLKPGSRVVVTTALRVKKQGTTNVMEIREIPREEEGNLLARAKKKLLGKFDK